MASEKDHYSLLGVPRNATLEEIRRAYREAALRLHPDRRDTHGQTQLFVETNQAYELLSDPERRAPYDKQLAEADRKLAESASFRATIQQSRKSLLQMDEPQVHYVLLDVGPTEDLPALRPPINLGIVIDQSTSMRGPRLDQVRSATLAILKELRPEDSATIVSFSDRAQVVITPDQARDTAVARARLSLLQAGGGTEIGQGLEAGLAEVQKNFAREGVNHLILLTDGRTYGDEDLCLSLADQASRQGIGINGVGIGADWSDRLLDDMATRTGGSVMFLDSPKAITGLLHDIFERLGSVVASRVRLEGAVAQQVDLRAGFKLLPEPMPMGDSLPMTLGHLPKNNRIRLLLEFVVHPIGEVTQLVLAYLTISGDVLGRGAEASVLPVQITSAVSRQPDPDPPPLDITAALNQIALYRMQDRARHEAELGQTTRAARRLENLATHLLAAGERDLAKAALGEAERLNHTRRLSLEGEKVLKYGTRALLLLPAKAGQS
ncbi:MAG: VWA domain-containing protein [Anaerolineales bacterium]|nr:VWA domain-containing protein [Anaerolineales bacterium]